MSDVPDMNTAYRLLIEAMHHSGDFRAEGIMARGAVLQASVQLENATRMSVASTQLAKSIDAFTAASDRGTAELAKWSASTARWTRALTFATIALFVVAVAQVLVMWFGRG